MARSMILAAFMTLLTVGVAAESYLSEFQNANDQMSQLYQQIGGVKSIATQNGHTPISDICNRAIALLDSAQSSWQDLSTTFESKPWLASDHSLSTTVQGQLSACGQLLQEINNHPDVKASGQADLYASHLQECQTTYDNCVHSCDNIWNWKPPSPQPSGGGYDGGYARKLKMKRNLLEDDDDLLCPKGETACPISAFSSGFECIDTNFELTSCGGCVTKGEGEDCSAIAGAAGVGCQAGKCVVLSVQRGYLLNQHSRPARRWRH